MTTDYVLLDDEVPEVSWSLKGTRLLINFMNKIGIVLVRYRYGPYEPYDSGEAVTVRGFVPTGAQELVYRFLRETPIHRRFS